MAGASAVVWRGGDTFEIERVRVPEPAPGEAVVRMSAATVCGSDRHTVSGRRPGACPSVLGHEGVGVVVSTNDARAVDGSPLESGDRVVFGVTAVCGECVHCRRGLTAKCTSVVKTGHESFDGPRPLSGTYSSHLHVLDGQAVVRVPESVPDGVAATAGCAVATVMAMLERAGSLSGRSVLVVGAGMLGVVAVAAARGAGAGGVIAGDPDPGRRSLAVAAGADEVLDPGADEVLAPAADPGGSGAGGSGAGGREVDVALELSGAPAGVRLAVGSLAIGGTAVLGGSVTPSESVSVDPEALVRGWRTVTGVHNYEPRHLAHAVDFLVESGDGLPWDRILGGPIRPGELAAEFAEPDLAFLRTVVDFRDDA